MIILIKKSIYFEFHLQVCSDALLIAGTDNDSSYAIIPETPPVEQLKVQISKVLLNSQEYDVIY